MAKSKKTTYDERIEIVEYCLQHDCNIKDAASIYGCSYGQLYNWLKKYESNGKDGLIDKRGRSRDEESLSELEIAQRKIQKLEQEKEEFRKRYELLKKAEKRERW